MRHFKRFHTKTTWFKFAWNWLKLLWPSHFLFPQGAVLGSFFWGYTLTQFIGGYLADQMGGEIIIITAAFFWGLFTIIFPVVPQLTSDPSHKWVSWNSTKTLFISNEYELEIILNNYFVKDYLFYSIVENFLFEFRKFSFLISVSVQLRGLIEDIFLFSV